MNPGVSTLWRIGVWSEVRRSGLLLESTRPTSVKRGRGLVVVEEGGTTRWTRGGNEETTPTYLFRPESTGDVSTTVDDGLPGARPRFGVSGAFIFHVVTGFPEGRT